MLSPSSLYGVPFNAQVADDELADIEAAIFMKSMGEIEVVSKEDKARQEKLAAQKQTPWCVLFFACVRIPLSREGSTHDFLISHLCQLAVNRHRYVEDNELIIKTGLIDKRKVGKKA